jgi:hypothetical protein
MNESELDPRSANCNESQSSNDDAYWLEIAIAARRKYSARWAAERWILRRYLRRFGRVLLSRFKPAKSAKSPTDELPF